MSASDDALAALGLNLGLGTSSLPNTGAMGMGSIYMGNVRVNVPRHGFAPGEITPGAGPGPTQGVNQPKWMSKDAVENLPLTWTDQEKNDFIHSGIMRKIPGFNQDMGLPDILKMWGKLTDYSDTITQSGTPMSPWDVMNTYKSREGQTYKKGNWEYDSVTDQPVKYVGPLTRTDTQTRVDLSTREDALALAKVSMAQMLGRAPRPEELTNYLNLLNGYEKEHPTTSTTTSQISPETGEVTSSATTSQGGVTQAGRQALLEQKMGDTTESAGYRASTTYYNAMMQEIMRGY